RNLDPSLRSQIKLLLSSVYKRLQTLETESGKRILHTPKKKELRGDWQEPIHVYGDCIGVTVFRGSIQADTFLRIWKEEKSRLGIQLDFHFAEGDYQTDD